MKQQNKDITPLYFEEFKINQEQETLTQFKQFIPTSFISIELREGNYCGSTNPKWKNKPLCERYGLDYQGNWLQIDIPHTIMESLELEKGKDITQPLYLDPQVLEKNPSYGGITIESEAEIILVNPNKMVMKEVEIQTELSGRELNQRIEGLETERDNLKEKHNQLRINISNILYSEIEGATLAKDDRELVNQAETIIKKLNDLKTELAKEKGWWDKWINDWEKEEFKRELGYSKYDENIVEFRKRPSLSTSVEYLKRKGEDEEIVFLFSYEGNSKGQLKEVDKFKKGLKIVYEYYKNKD